MEIKTIEQIKEEVAEEYGYKTNSGFSAFEQIIINPHHISYKGLSKIFDQVAIRYASQFQNNTDLITTEICVLRERVSELEEYMKECASVLSWVLDNARPDSDWQTFTNIVMNAMVEAKSLINKGR